MKFYLTLAAGLVAAAPLFAESHGAAAEGEAMAEEAAAELTVSGDVAAGEKAFKKCVSCHVVVNEAGETLAGKKAKTGPNLYGIAGGMFGKVEDFKYGKDSEPVAAMDVVFTETEFAAYVADPSAWLSDKAGEKARSKMTYKVKKEQDALDLFAYLHSLQQ